MKKKIITGIGIATLLSQVAAAMLYAQSPSISRDDIRRDRQEIRNDMKDLKNDLKNKKGVRLLEAQVTAVGSSSLTVTKDGKTYTVNAVSDTKFRRRFGGTSSLSEISVGDKVSVWGSFTDDAKTTIAARLIRDLSIMKRFGAFIGVVKSKNGQSFVFTTVARGDQTVVFDASTKFVNRKEQPISSSDVAVGHRVRVKGMWDKALSKITEVSQVKDFSLPPKPSPSSAK